MSIISKILRAPYRIWKYLMAKHKYASFGWHTSVDKPLRVEHPENIYLDDNVSIHRSCWIAANPLLKEKPANGGECKLVIKKGSTIGDFCHIYATREIIIEENVLLANYIYISDNLHGYENINIPIIKQPIVQKDPVHIGEGTWIGEHACIIGASVGKHCVIGANSVVTRDIPDYCVAVGSPAKVIKKYNSQTQKWEKVK